VNAQGRWGLGLVVAGALMVAPAWMCPAVASAESPPTITKGFSAGSVELGGTTDATFTITNPNETPLTGIAFDDALPAGLVVSDSPIVTDECSPPDETTTTTAIPGSSSISLANGELGPSATCQVVIQLRATSQGTKDNTTGPITSNESGPGSPSNTASIDVTPAKPSINKLFSDDAATVGSTVGLSFSLSNPAGNGPLTGVAFTDALPSGLEVANPNALSSDCGGTLTAAPASASIELTDGTLADGATCSISVNLSATSPGEKNNQTSQLTSNEAPPGDPSFATLAVVDPPTFTKDFDATSMGVGDTTPLSFTIANPPPATRRSAASASPTPCPRASRSRTPTA
jgi:uncharacterized repeat protein (TIGR01451 family)